MESGVLSRGKMTQWLVDFPHVIPLNDLREHEPSEACWCRPLYDEGVVIHHAADEREEYETGRRRAS